MSVIPWSLADGRKQKDRFAKPKHQTFSEKNIYVWAETSQTNDFIEMRFKKSDHLNIDENFGHVRATFFSILSEKGRNWKVLT